MSIKFDPTKEHSLFCGVMENGARYKQKGRLFKADGELVDPDEQIDQVDYKSMPIGKIKALLEERDEPFTNKAEAVEFLIESGYSE